MSLVRAFTTRRNRADRPDVGRAASKRDAKAGVSRLQISGPVALISTTNTLAYDAPDIAGTVPIAYDGPSNMSYSSGSVRSAEDSDASSVGGNSRGTITDASSIDESPLSPEPNHLSCYFKPSVYTDSTHSRNASVTSAHFPSMDAPIIPKRAPSHSKKAHAISHQRSVSNQRSISRLSPPATPHDSIVTDSSDYYRSSTQQSPHPFGKELEQLNEVVEEFGSVVRDAEADADLVFMEAHGLDHFCAADYMMEIQDMLSTVFEEDQMPFEQAGFF